MFCALLDQELTSTRRINFLWLNRCRQQHLCSLNCNVAVTLIHAFPRRFPSGLLSRPLCRSSGYSDLVSWSGLSKGGTLYWSHPKIREFVAKAEETRTVHT